jgi:hypothetical protein
MTSKIRRSVSGQFLKEPKDFNTEGAEDSRRTRKETPVAKLCMLKFYRVAPIKVFRVLRESSAPSALKKLLVPVRQTST